VTASTLVPPSTRNRAVDALRAGSMCAVVIGHWLASHVGLDSAGNPTGGNGLADMASLHWVTWLFQVMPLFFCVGGFANAASLASAERAGTPDRIWVALRLRRLLAPVAVFAGAWLAIVGTAALVGAGGIAAMAAKLAAIPLWFMAVYTLDIALAPTLRRLWVRHGWAFLGALVALVCCLDLAHQAGAAYIEIVNVFVGWSIFQVLGMAWHAGAFRRSHAMGLAPIAGAIAVGLVAFGPWPVSMVQVPGADISNTWPPTAALIAFGLAQCSVAVLVAPAIDRRLARNDRVWKLVMVASSMAMSVYLWHLTALAVAAAIAWALGLLSTAPAGTTAAWAAKAPIMVMAAAVLAGIVAIVWRFERRSLLDRSTVEVQAAPIVAAVLATVIAFEALTTTGAGHPAGAVGAIALVTVASWLRRSSLASTS
jgi:hypothetical protein